MKRIFTLMLIAICSIGIASAQRITTVYLNNGSIIKGELVEYAPGEKLSIQTADGSLFVYNPDEIKSLELPTTTPNAEVTNKHLAPRGYRGFVEFSPHFLGNFAFDLHTIHGYQFKHGLFVGGGIGYYLRFDDIYTQYLPVYAAIQSNVGEKLAQFTYGGRLGFVVYSKSDYINDVGRPVLVEGFYGC
ncbi:MAG: hypothetical protein IKK16_06275, partial [Bacteroidaceae bacterium]|nr:hypothetical protein [Bacteroidaceae bacterium]